MDPKMLGAMKEKGMIGKKKKKMKPAVKKPKKSPTDSYDINPDLEQYGHDVV